LSWYTLDDPESPQLDELAQQFHLHPLHVEDCRSHGERVKAEQAPDYLFIILRSVERLKNARVEFKKVSIFVGKDFCITIADSSCPGIHNALERARRKEPEQHPSRILYVVFDTLIDSYMSALDWFVEEIDKLEDSVLDCPEPRVLQDIFEKKRNLIQMRRVLGNTRDVCLFLQRDAEALIEKDLWPFFRDVYDHVARNLDTVETLRDQVTNTLDVYLSSVANRTNEVMKVLTVLSTIALPSLVISGIYGMNLKWIPFADSPYAPFVVFGVMGITTVVLLVLLRKFRWI
jgi:magnesium transporter